MVVPAGALARTLPISLMPHAMAGLSSRFRATAA